jgi:hypothetical protein
MRRSILQILDVGVWTFRSRPQARNALAAAFLLASAIARRHHRPSLAAEAGRVRTPMIAASGLVVACLTAWSFSIAPRIAWDGGYVRREGVYTVLCYMTFFVVIGFLVRSRKQVDLLILAFLLASIFPVMYAICQRLNLDLFLWNNPTPTRVTSTAGNSISWRIGGHLDGVLTVNSRLPGSAFDVDEGITLAVDGFHFVQDEGRALFHVPRN